ncbi:MULTISPECIES: hypothetical protein [unclassified Bosea (in: a-proteobacteria)]|uniref:hypothetical protein n=1 Tax=unclassified Bosea (in: a-proteobacteria) TaxID=2653178 RepID=UPI00125EBBD7|nr:MULTISPECIES: hypothetical protein [unclassified Bosea (in: a-proteobacteria)]
MAVIGQSHGLRRGHRQARPVEFAGARLDRGDGLIERRTALRREAALDLRQAAQMGEVLEIPVALRGSRGDIRLRIRLQCRIEDDNERYCGDGEQSRHASQEPEPTLAP